MSFDGPVLLLAGPLVAALLTLSIGRWRRAAAALGGIESLIMWGMLMSLPLAPTNVERAARLFAGDTLVAFGRTLLLTEGIRALFLLLLVGTSILCLFAVILPQGRHFVPAGLAALSPLAGALMVQPFAFGALLLLLAMAILVAAIQAERVTSTGPALRFLLMAVLAIPLFLIAGWMLSGEQQALLEPASLLLLIGSIILLAGFPFHIWVSPIVVEATAMPVVLIFGLVQLVLVTFITDMLRATPGLQGEPLLVSTLQLSGVTTALLAALLAAISTDLRRWLSSFLLLDMGMTLLALTADGQEGWRLAATGQMARTISLLLASVGLRLIQGKTDGSFVNLHGGGRRDPLGFSLLIYGCASLLGLPLTVGFAGRWAIVLQFHQASGTPWLPYLLLLAMLGATIGLLRGMKPLLLPADQDVKSDLAHSIWLRGSAILLFLFAGLLAFKPVLISDYVGNLVELLR